MSKLKKVISLLLTLAIAMTPVPQKAYADALPSMPELEESLPTPKILGEATEKREKNIKHFLNEDMSFTAAIYPTAVHYLENGKWQDIDNRLKDGVDESSLPVLENSKNSYKVKIAKNSNARKLVSISKDKYEISWNLMGGDKSKTVVVLPEDAASPEKSKLKLKNLQSTVRFSEILPGLDVEYVVMPEEVKENLILKEKGNVPEISFSLYLTNVVPSVTEDNRVLFSDAETGTAVMEMPAPFMVDAAGEASYGVGLKVTPVKNGEYTLSLTPDNLWLSEEARAYPVVLDPIVRTVLVANQIFLIRLCLQLIPQRIMSIWVFSRPDTGQVLL